MANCTLYENVTNLVFTTDLFWWIQKNISEACPNHQWLKPGTGALTTEAARHLVGISSNAFLSIWRFWPYSGKTYRIGLRIMAAILTTCRAEELIFARFQVWKLPLIALITMMPQPPQSKSIGLLSIFHLLGDPIDTIASLIFTLDLTRSLVRAFRQNGMDYKRRLEQALLVSTLRYVGDEEDARDLENMFGEDVRDPDDM